VASAVAISPAPRAKAPIRTNSGVQSKPPLVEAGGVFLSAPRLLMYAFVYYVKLWNGQSSPRVTGINTPA